MAARAIERKIGDIVVVVAELLELSGGALLERIEGWRIREERIAPAEQWLTPIALGNMMGGVDPGLDLLEVETIGHGAAAEAPQNRVPDGLAGLGAPRRIVMEAAALLKNWSFLAICLARKVRKVAQVRAAP